MNVHAVIEEATQTRTYARTHTRTHTCTHAHTHTHLGVGECPQHLQQLSLCFPVDPIHDAEHLLDLTLLNTQTDLLEVSEYLQAGEGTARYPWMKE